MGPSADGGMGSWFAFSRSNQVGCLALDAASGGGGGLGCFALAGLRLCWLARVMGLLAGQRRAGGAGQNLRLFPASRNLAYSVIRNAVMAGGGSLSSASPENNNALQPAKKKKDEKKKLDYKVLSEISSPMRAN